MNKWSKYIITCSNCAVFLHPLVTWRVSQYHRENVTLLTGPPPYHPFWDLD